MEDNIYVLLHGPAHIKPISPEKIEVNFLDKDQIPKPKSISFTLKDPETGALNPLKIVSLHIVVECGRTEFERLKAAGELVNYFPDSYPENYLVVEETPFNARGMNPSDPPTGKP